MAEVYTVPQTTCGMPASIGRAASSVQQMTISAAALAEAPTTELSSPCTVAAIEERIAPLRARLTAHPLYSVIHDERGLRLFMQSHVFAVWDFMGLLKSLQRQLTSVETLWVPTPFAASRRFLNEIVFGEESDEYQHRPISHFEIYLEAMQAAGADTAAIEHTIAAARRGSLDLSQAPPAARAFVESTYRVIREGSLAAQAAAFTFGREDVIPDMFRGMVRELNAAQDGAWSQFVWYLERHIEVDGDEHGPLSLRMVADLCGDSPERWQDAGAAAETAIRARLALWDGVLAEIQAGG
jgi:hypothetical protein